MNSVGRRDRFSITSVLWKFHTSGHHSKSILEYLLSYLQCSSNMISSSNNIFVCNINTLYAIQSCFGWIQQPYARFCTQILGVMLASQTNFSGRTSNVILKYISKLTELLYFGKLFDSFRNPVVWNPFHELDARNKDIVDF
jgi:hypothetical protein